MDDSKKWGQICDFYEKKITEFEKKSGDFYALFEIERPDDEKALMEIENLQETIIAKLKGAAMTAYHYKIGFDGIKKD